MTNLITGGTGKTGSRVAHHLDALGHPTAGPSPATASPGSTGTTTPPGRAPSRAAPRLTSRSSLTSASRAPTPSSVRSPGAPSPSDARAWCSCPAAAKTLHDRPSRVHRGRRRVDHPALGVLLPELRRGLLAEEIATGSLTMVQSTVGEPFVDADDIADVALATLLDPAHIGRIHELTGRG